MQKWTVVKGNDIKNKTKNAFVVFEEWKMQNKYYSLLKKYVLFCHPSIKQTASPFSVPTKVTAILQIQQKHS